MAVKGLDHVNIQCRPEDLPAMRRFWGEVVGLEEGRRPAFDFPGIWFWAGGGAVVHIAAKLPDGTKLPAADGGTFGHIAFRAEGLAETRARLARFGIATREAPVPGFPLHQIFFSDPAGIAVELTFAA